MSAIPLGNILTGVGSLGALVMLPHLLFPAKMCKMFLEEKFTDNPTSASQLILLHFGLFSNLFWLAVTIAVAGQTCPCLPVGYAFCAIIILRLVHVFMGFKNEKLGLARKPVMIQVIVGLILAGTVLTATIMASSDEAYLAATKAMEATAFDKMDDAAPLVYFIIGISLFFALMSAPGMCMPDKMIDGYIPNALTLADNYAGTQMKFYMAFQSREQLFFWLLLAALMYMSPDITYLGYTICAMCVHFIGFCTHAILNNATYGFAPAGILFWFLCMSVILGATSMGLLLI